MAITTLKNDASFSNTMKINGKVVETAFTVRPSEKELRHVLTCQIDYSKCSPAELMELANRSVVIDLQRQWRTMAATKGSTARTVNPFAKVDVKAAIVDAARKTADPRAKALSAFSKLSAKDQAELLKALKSA